MQIKLGKWIENYRAPVEDYWRGRSDGVGAPRFHEKVSCHTLEKPLSIDPSKKNLGLIGFASDEGVKRNQGREGAVEGPRALKTSLAPLPLQNDTNKVFYDFGEISCHDKDLESAQQALATVVTELLKNNIQPIVLGGGHEVAWGHYLGIAKAFPETDCSIINFDAHYDIRPLSNGLGSSGTSFKQIFDYNKEHCRSFNYTCIGVQTTGNTKALFKEAKEMNIYTVNADQLHIKGYEAAERAIQRAIHSSTQIYVTVCLDLFAAPFAPGVSSPQPLGLFPWHILPHLETLAQSGKVIGIDIAELSPRLDRDNATAHLGASLIGRFMDTLQ